MISIFIDRQVILCKVMTANPACNFQENYPEFFLEEPLQRTTLIWVQGIIKCPDLGSTVIL